MLSAGQPALLRLLGQVLRAEAAVGGAGRRVDVHVDDRSGHIAERVPSGIRAASASARITASVASHGMAQPNAATKTSAAMSAYLRIAGTANAGMTTTAVSATTSSV